MSVSRSSAVRLLPFAFLVASGCADSPTAARRGAEGMQRVENRDSRLVTCGTTWKAAVSGVWHDATKWSAGVPHAGLDACITVPGTYTVALELTQSARSLQVGAPGNAEQPTLSIQGVRPSGSGGSTSAFFTVSGDVENHGTIVLTSTGWTTSGSVFFTVNGTLRNAEGATVTTRVGSHGARTFTGHLVNHGTVRVEAITQFNGTGKQLQNEGRFEAVSTANFSNSPVFVQAAGELVVTGALNHTGGRFELDGGVITGIPTISLATLDIGVGSTATGTVRLTSTNSIRGDVQAGQTVLIEGIRPSGTGSATHAQVSAVLPFRNRGTIRLWSTGWSTSGSATLSVNGSLTNEATGVIETLPGSGGSRIINAAISNHGLLDIRAITQYNLAGAILENFGTLRVAPAITFNLASPRVYQIAGLLDVTDAAWNQTGGQLQLNGGVVAGVPSLSNGNLHLPLHANPQGTVRLTGANTMTGRVHPGVTVLIEGIRPSGTGAAIHSTVTSIGDIINNGTIRMWSTGWSTSGGAVLNVTEGTLTNSASGRFEILPGSGGGRVITGNLTNQGQLQLAANTNFNAGTLRTTGAVTGGATLILAAGTVFHGAGSMTASISNQGQVHVGESPGLLALTGSYAQGAAGTLNVELGGSPGGVGHDRLFMSGSAVLAGTLRVTAVPGECVNPGGVYEVMRFASRSGDFTTKVLQLDATRTATALPGATDYRLSTAGNPCSVSDATPPAITPSVVGLLGDNGWYRGNVSVSWNVTDAESAISASSGCAASAVTTDHAGITFTCSATSAGGTASASVTIKRDATAPVVSVGRSPAANVHGWNNTGVTATWTATDAMSGIAGDATYSQLFSAEGENHGAVTTFRDQAGNVATSSIEGINIDLTGPLVSVTRTPPPNEYGWNNTDVTATFTASDALSGVAGDASTVLHFTADGTNQGGSQTFTDRAGNSRTASIGGINIQKALNAPGCSVTPDVLWPANGRMVSVQVTFSSTAGLVVTLRSANSNEPGAAADIAGFTLGTMDLAGQVRASRDGSGSGRVYTLTYDVRDYAGNTGECAVTIRVPHDQRGK